MELYRQTLIVSWCAIWNINPDYMSNSSTLNLFKVEYLKWNTLYYLHIHTYIYISVWYTIFIHFCLFKQIFYSLARFYMQKTNSCCHCLTVTLQFLFVLAYSLYMYSYHSCSMLVLCYRHYYQHNERRRHHYLP